MPGGAGGRVVAEAPEALMRRLAGDAERVGDLGPCRPPVQGAADEPLEVGLGGVDDVHLSGRLVEGVESHREQIDDRIRAQAENWRLERMPSVDRNILRLAIYEMWHQNDVPKLVVVDEAVELAKRFGSEQSGRFVNGVLDGLMKNEPMPGSLR